LSGGEIQFGANAVVDGQGTVHLVYTDRANAEATTFGQLVYRKSTPEGGWTDPVPVAPAENAGHQLSPELALDNQGGLHVVWQDQRYVGEEYRSGDQANAANADVLSADLLPDGSWSGPVAINVRPNPETNASRPQIALDGDRLIATWSVYDAAAGLSTAARVEWASRSISDPAWTPAATLISSDNSQIGGRLVDLTSNPAGGTDVVYGRRVVNGDTATTTLYTQKLAAGANEWSEAVALISGNTRGAYPKVAAAADGTLYIVYNLGTGAVVQTGAVAYVAGQPRSSVETVLTAGEDGAQGIASVAVDANGRIWVIYMHEPTGGRANEIRVLRSAIISTELAPEQPAASPVANPEASATPAS
jgi:hypothetical protein